MSTPNKFSGKVFRVKEKNVYFWGTMVPKGSLILCLGETIETIETSYVSDNAVVFFVLTGNHSGKIVRRLLCGDRTEDFFSEFLETVGQTKDEHFLLRRRVSFARKQIK